MSTHSASKQPSSRRPARPAQAGAGAPGFEAPDFGQMAEAGQRSMAALAEIHSRSVREAMRFNSELLDFARRRLSADIQTSDRLARCTSLTEAMDAIGDFYQGAFRDYAEETTALVRLGIETGTGNAREAAAEASGSVGGKPDRQD